MIRTHNSIYMLKVLAHFSCLGEVMMNSPQKFSTLTMVFQSQLSLWSIHQEVSITLSSLYKSLSLNKTASKCVNLSSLGACVIDDIETGTAILSARQAVSR